MNHQNTFNPYPKEVLPLGFSYPTSYLKLSKNVQSIKYDDKYPFPWWFTDDRDNINEDMKLYEEMTGQKGLIVFARNGDWAAYFSSYDTSGDPEVIVYDLGATNDGSFVVENFDTWLKMAINDTWR